MKLRIVNCELRISRGAAGGKNSQFAIRNSKFAHAFTLLEVMIAIAIFFVASFAILGLISTSLQNVRRLQRPSVDASPVLARYAATNSLIEGTYQGSLGDPDLLGKGYRDYNWVANIVEVASNHLYSVECVIRSANGRPDIISDMTTVLYRPQSPPGTLDGGIGMRGR
jgi:prepilin-type N-terminal cleavage/methylation domain-containing protein